MWTKKKDGKDVDVQDIWIGHIIPFTLIQEEKFSELFSNFRSYEKRHEANSSLYSGYDKYYAIPYSENNGFTDEWLDYIGMKLLNVVKKKGKNLIIIAEDLTCLKIC